MPKINKEIREKILLDISNGNISQKEIAKKFNISPAYVTIIKNDNIGRDDDLRHIIKKGTKYKIRITHYIKGSTKNKFIKDCLDKKYKEAQMANHIFDVYYYMQDSIHNFDKIEPNKIKDYLKARIKL